MAPLNWARVLGSHAKEHPERFARLAHSFSEEIPVVAMIEIIANVEESIDLETLTALCEYAHHTYGAAAGQAVCSAIGRAGAANSSLVALLGAYARDTDPDDETPQSGASSSVHPLLGDLFTTGLNSTRGKQLLRLPPSCLPDPTTSRLSCLSSRPCAKTASSPYESAQPKQSSRCRTTLSPGTRLSGAPV